MHHQLKDPFSRVIEAAMERQRKHPLEFMNEIDENDSFGKVLRAAYLRDAERTKDLSNSYERYLNECQRGQLTPLTFEDWIKTLTKDFIFSHPDWDGDQ